MSVNSDFSCLFTPECSLGVFSTLSCKYLFTNTYKMKTIEEVKKRIEMLGIKKSHVAKKIGVTPVEFSHFLSGRRVMPDDVRKKLVDYLF